MCLGGDDVDYINQIIQGDCLEVMPNMPDKSIDMILCDLPYGTTACKWDTIIPFEPLWKEYKRIIKDNGAIILFGNEPFSSYLRLSNLGWYRYDLIWRKTKAPNFIFGNKQPMKLTENIVVFYNKQPIYNPIYQKIIGRCCGNKKTRGSANMHNEIVGCSVKKLKYNKVPRKKLPNNIIEMSNAYNGKIKRLHPTQKPVPLFEHLIKTYTNEGNLVLDNCAGSGTTGVACKNLGRNYILIEKEEKYVEISRERIKAIPELLF